MFHTILERIARAGGSLLPRRPAPLKPDYSLWFLIKIVLKACPPGNPTRSAVAGILANCIVEHPEYAARLHPARKPFHREILLCVLKHPKMSPEMRADLMKNPEITASLL
jgi:hypothetical protein